MAQFMQRNTVVGKKIIDNSIPPRFTALYISGAGCFAADMPQGWLVVPCTMHFSLVVTASFTHSNGPVHVMP